METIARKESRRLSSPRWPGRLLIEARRVTHSSPPIVLELELVLDPSVEFLLKSSRVHPVGCS
jgi:hypothetical protein